MRTTLGRHAHRMNRYAALAVAVIVFFAGSEAAQACSLNRPPSIKASIRHADLIVRVTLLAESAPSDDPDPSSWGVRLRFQVDEVLKGPPVHEIVLRGIVSEADDFNDHGPPYRSVRPAGRSGSCYAHEYRVGAHYLLVLGGSPGSWFLNGPLAPVNEQIRGPDDPWVSWVRKRIK